MLSVLLFGFCITAVLSNKEDQNRMLWMEGIVPQNYLSYLPPSYQLHWKNRNYTEPTRIYLEFFPQFLMSVEPKTMDFAVEFVIYLDWRDERLIIPKYVIDLPKEIAVKLWTPDISLLNCKFCEHALVVAAEQRFKLYRKYNAVHVKITGIRTFTCEIDLKNYPFDIQKCSVIISKRNSRKWVPFDEYCIKHSMDTERINAPPEFSLKSVKIMNCTNSSDLHDDCLEYVFHLHRQYTHHIMLFFVPSKLIVMLSWISFWLDPEVAAPRVALGLTSLLTLATQFNNAQRDLPPVATVKALDIWMFVCIIMVFCSLIEFAIANNSVRKHKKSKVKTIRNTAKVFPRTTNGRNRVRNYSAPTSHTVCKANEPQVSCVDLFARVIFPLTFVVFNIIYWTYFLHNGTD